MRKPSFERTQQKPSNQQACDTNALCQSNWLSTVGLNTNFSMYVTKDFRDQESEGRKLTNFFFRSGNMERIMTAQAYKAQKDSSSK